MSTLGQIHLDIESRVAAIRANQPDWLCAKGCDSCCRRLAEVPQLSAAEWHVLRDGLAALAPDRLGQLRQALAALAVSSARPVVCPLLDVSTGACPLYAQRPVACRTYGFYVQRDSGLYCQAIEARVADGTLADVVWGNHDAIDSRLKGLGESRALTDWFALWDGEQAPLA